MAFPADYERWIENGMVDRAAVQDTTSDIGSFVLQTVQPGDYLVAAVGPAVSGRWHGAGRGRVSESIYVSLDDPLLGPILQYYVQGENALSRPCAAPA